MTKKLFSSVILTALFGVLGPAQAAEVPEQEDNHPIGSAEEVTFIGDQLVIKGFIDNRTCSAPEDMNDADFFRFHARKDDVVTLDIDQGWGGMKSVDLEMALFTDGDFEMLHRSEDALPPLDEGSSMLFDPRLEEITIPEDGYYIVGVISDDRNFVDGGLVEPRCTFPQFGDYTLVISGVTTTSPVVNVNIEIKPAKLEKHSAHGKHSHGKYGKHAHGRHGHGKHAHARHGHDRHAHGKHGKGKKGPRVHPKSNGKLRVALLSSDDFDPTMVMVEKDTLTFGRTGEEHSLSHCPGTRDVNRDGRPDLICFFNTKSAGFEPDSTSGFIRGQTQDGREFKGRGLYEPVPARHQKASRGNHHHHHHHHRHHHDHRRGR